MGFLVSVLRGGQQGGRSWVSWFRCSELGLAPLDCGGKPVGGRDTAFHTRPERRSRCRAGPTTRGKGLWLGGWLRAIGGTEPEP